MNTLTLRVARWASVVPPFIALAVLATSVRAQTSIRITEPAEWDAGRPAAAQPGIPLKVAGLVNEPAGVRRVLVGGKPARLQADPNIHSLVRFDISFLPDPTAREVTIIVEPNGGAPIPRRYALTIAGEGAQPAARAPASAPGPPPPPDTASGGYATIPVIEVHPDSAAGRYATVSEIEVHATLPNPWRPFTVRGVGYVALAGAGIYLATLKKSTTAEVCTGPTGREDCVDRTVISRPSAGLGLGIAAGAALLGTLDALLTSRRAHAARAEEQRPGRTGLLRPALETDGSSARLALLRLAF